MNLWRHVQPSQRTEEGYLKPACDISFFSVLSSKLIEKISSVKMMIENAFPKFTDSYYFLTKEAIKNI